MVAFMIKLTGYHHRNIKFIIEKENNKILSFLDILIKNEGSRFSISIYRKKASIGLFTEFHSFTPMSFKIGLIRCLIDIFLKLVVNTLYFITNWKRLKFCYRKTCTIKALLIIKLKPF